MSDVPVLETERLRLRGHRVEDLPAFLEMWADPEVVRHITGTPSTEQRSWMRMLGYAGHWALMGFGYWAIEEKGSGRFVGDAGFADWRRVLTPPITGLPELGWALAGWAHGRGFATEAVRAATAWGDRHLGAACTVCVIDPANARSVRVAEKVGFREVSRATFEGAPTLLFARDASPSGR